MTSSIPTSESASTNEVLVRVNGVSKKFCRDLKKSLWYGVKDVAAELFPFGKQKSEIRDRRSDSSASSSSPPSDSGLRPGEFWANKDISFELRRGQCLGLIGHNGAGKTTLLKMLNGLIKPDEGTIEMRGRVGALIALGAGFNPILTGRENIYVNGSILGLTKEEIDTKIEDIIEFAEIEDFIDSPVQSYSSGMNVRLGFAVASSLEPDVLIIDEALAVGDVQFKTKCYNRLAGFRSKTAMILVSHQKSDLSRVCDYGLVLDKGVASSLKSLSEAFVDYDNITLLKSSKSNDFSIDGISVNDIKLETNSISWGDNLAIMVNIVSEQFIARAHCRVSILDSAMNCVAEYNSINHSEIFEIKFGNNRMKINLKKIKLSSGMYTLNYILSDPATNSYLILKYSFASLTVSCDCKGLTTYQI
jgi:lipopolysaccharide transport system ATP-binding protein